MEAREIIEMLVAQNLRLQAETEVLKAVLFQEISNLYSLNQKEWDSALIEQRLATLVRQIALKKIEDLDWGPDWSDALNDLFSD